MLRGAHAAAASCRQRDAVIDSDRKKQHAYDRVEPRLQGLHSAVESPQMTDAERQNPGYGQHGQRRGRGEYGRQKPSVAAIGTSMPK